VVLGELAYINDDAAIDGESKKTLGDAMMS